MQATGAPRSLVAAVLAAACGGGATIAPPAPGPAQAAPPGIVLEPTEAALRVAQDTETTGRELGGLWTLDDPPLSLWNEAYGFEPTQQWLERARRAAVRYGDTCSGAFVSATGLVATSHRCARPCLEANATDSTDYLQTGFLATARARELECPGLHLDQLVGTEDVTARVRGAAPPGADPAAAAALRAAEIDRIERECTALSGACAVVALYNGARHHLHRYRRWPLVKLVFAPELQAGFFGGAPDDLAYPRYALDVAFVRAYDEDGAAAASADHRFEWDADGAEEDDPVFVVGSPGATSRLITASQLLYEAEYRHPFLIQLLDGQHAILQALADANPGAAREARQQLFEMERTLKAFRGRSAALADSLLVGRKLRWERELRARVAASAGLQAEYGDLWDRMAAVQRRKAAISPRLNVSSARFVGAPHLAYAGRLAAWVEDAGRPATERSDDLRGEDRAQVEAMLRTPTAVDARFARDLLRLHLAIARRWLAPGDTLLALLFARADETPDAAADRLIAESRVLDVTFRDALMRGGPDSLAAANDPLLRFARVAGPLYDSLDEEWRALAAQESHHAERLGSVVLAAGARVPSDGTFTLRVADGVVRRYASGGTVLPPFTTLFGMFGRAAAFGDARPWTLPEAFGRNRARIDLATRLAFVSTADVAGGNSGSAAIDRAGRIVGVVSGVNMDGLAGDFVFDTTSGRAIAVHSAGILEALRAAYGARTLVAELTAR